MFCAIKTKQFQKSKSVRSNKKLNLLVYKLENKNLYNIPNSMIQINSYASTYFDKNKYI